MRTKRLKISAILLLGLGLTGLQAQTMYVQQSNGTQTAFVLSNVQKITFATGNVTVHKTDKSTGVFVLRDLRYLNFNDLATSITEPLMQSGNASLFSYPNPVTDVLNIDLTGVTGEGTISILTHNGKVMQMQHTSGNSLVTLNLSHLSQGIYICRYVNALETKTVKFVKQ